MPGRIELRIANSLDELRRVDESLETFLAGCGVHGKTAFHIRLAVDELVTNVITHGYDDQSPHEILLTLELTPGTARMSLEDDGRPFDPLSRPEPDVHAPLECRPVGGLGIHFVRATMDGVEYQRTDGKNILRMIKKIP